MRLFVKVFGIALFLALLFLGGFLVWGDRFDLLFSQEACIIWLGRIRSYGWLVGIGLLLSDLLLPIPASGIMAALGAVYGVWLGAAVSIVGSTGAGLLGYGLARWAGPGVRRHLASEAELDRFRSFFDTWGAAAIIVSRMLPILPEVITILAGLAAMAPGRFVIALLLGTVPASLLFVYVGYAARSVPLIGMLLAALIPLLLWPIFLRFFPRRRPLLRTP